MVVSLHFPTNPFISLHDYLYSQFIYNIYILCGTIITRIRFPIFPLLIQRGLCESEHGSKSFKLFLSKCFSKDVNNFLICGTMS